MRKIRRFSVVLLVVLGLMLPINMAFADGSQEQSDKELSAEWWQWVYSFPPAVNPVLDTTDQNCVVGQRGDVWLLVGTFGGTATRTCSVPEGKAFFFPVINSSFFDSPGTCGQGPESYTVKEMRAFIAPFIDDATNLKATLDGRPVENVRRIKSDVFEMYLPNDNLGGSGCPGGVYSPAVGDGYYGHLDPLKPGPHELQIHAESSGWFVLDVTYYLTVAPVKRK